MVSALIQAGTIPIDIYDEEETALFHAYMDIQEELQLDAQQEKFALPLEKDLVEFLKDKNY